MPTPAREPAAFIRLERLGELAILEPTAAVEQLKWDMVECIADLVLESLQQRPPTGIIVDLHQVPHFGSVFIALLLRFHKLIKLQGGDLVLCRAHPPARELLRITGLDTLWAIYDHRDEAIRALS
ncbi:MAG: STAS domain-containing protein [Gemmatales bacterium]|nr:STAS domain-containing protein [Gemmatales bacterium]MDW8176750.1 STAS domain-containing protein [Gemmatales bacterium]MDW8222036.1 STAS domain-containing protein [Gemmatales bacterium]